MAIEVPHGPVVESFIERGFAVHAINPKQLDRFRDRFSPPVSRLWADSKHTKRQEANRVLDLAFAAGASGYGNHVGVKNGPLLDLRLTAATGHERDHVAPSEVVTSFLDLDFAAGADGGESNVGPITLGKKVRVLLHLHPATGADGRQGNVAVGIYDIALFDGAISQI